jgi:hypothetical protein
VRDEVYMNEHDRSEWACPVCGSHTLALDEPPRIDIMGVQVYSDLVGMGDVTPGGSLGIVCLTCDTRWADKGAFDRNDPDPSEDFEAALGDESVESELDEDKNG